MKRLEGIPASRGICIGPIFQFVRRELAVEEVVVDDPAAETARLNEAITTAKDQISEIYEKADGRPPAGFVLDPAVCYPSFQGKRTSL